MFRRLSNKAQITLRTSYFIHNIALKHSSKGTLKCMFIYVKGQNYFARACNAYRDCTELSVILPL